MRWVFLTIRTCIEKVDERFNGASRNIVQQRQDESMLGFNRDRWPIMSDLKPFYAVINSVIDSLNAMANVRTYQKNSKYYESTLQKLIEKLFQQDNDEEEEGLNDNEGRNHLFNKN